MPGLTSPEQMCRGRLSRNKRWGILISGRGSNLGALMEHLGEVDIGVVLSSNPKAPGILRARRRGVRAEATPFLEQTRKIDWQKLSARLNQYGITHLFLAGFMKIVPADFVALWEGRIVNLHPSLLPQYPGLKSIERAYIDKTEIGITVHEVNAEVDAGRIIQQRRSLNESEVRDYSLASVEFLVHVDEQRLVKEAIRRWKIGPNEGK